MYDLLEDVSILTTIPTWQLRKLSEIASKDICHCLLESDGQCVFDIGIGTLTVNAVGDEMRYKFIPSKKLEEEIIRSFTNDKDSLESTIEASANMRMLRVYKDLI